MKEILFRGKRKDNGKWIEGYFYINATGHYFILKAEEPDIDGWYEGDFVDFNEVIPKTVGQYTGLKDKNGKKIFEGDLLDFDNREWGDVFEPEIITFKEITGEWKLAGSKQDLNSFRTVVGNIHDNKE